MQPSATSQSLPRRHGMLRQVNVMTAPQLLASAIPCPILLRYRNRLFSHNKVRGAVRKEEYLHWVSTLLASYCADTVHACNCCMALKFYRALLILNQTITAIVGTSSEWSK